MKLYVVLPKNSDKIKDVHTGYYSYATPKLYKKGYAEKACRNLNCRTDVYSENGDLLYTREEWRKYRNDTISADYQRSREFYIRNNRPVPSYLLEEMVPGLVDMSMKTYDEYVARGPYVVVEVALLAKQDDDEFARLLK